MRTFAFGVFVSLSVFAGGCAVGSGSPGADDVSGSTTEQAPTESAEAIGTSGASNAATIGRQTTRGLRLNETDPGDDPGHVMGPQPIPWQPNGDPTRYHIERSIK